MADRLTPEQARTIAYAYCRTRFAYDGPYAQPDGAASHLNRDVERTAEQLIDSADTKLYAPLIAIYRAGQRDPA